MMLILLSLFLIYTNIYVSIAQIVTHTRFEQEHYQEIQAFSLLESKTIYEIVKRMEDYKLDDFTLIYNNIHVKITILDELILIVYDLIEPIYARLDYDLVFNSSLDYQIISYETYEYLTKNEISIK